MELKRVVVTGMGAVTPVGLNPKETWENLLAGKSGAAPITLFDASKFKTQFACEVKGLDISEYIDRKEARKMDRYTQLAIIAAMQAVQDSGMDLETEDKNRIGVVYGVGIGGIKTFEEEVMYYGKNEENGPKFNPFFIPKMIADRFPSCTVSTVLTISRLLPVLLPATRWLMPSTSFVWVRPMPSLPAVPRLLSAPWA